MPLSTETRLGSIAGMDASTPVRVVIADDHPVYREGLARAIAARPELELVGEAADGKDAARLIDEAAPDVAVLDAHMPGIDGITLSAWASTRGGERRTRVVLLSAYVDGVLVRRAEAAGASGYVGKDSTREDICRAIVQVAAGGKVFRE
jgi:two-component system, NarL family, nitrate/nitrite response regulator NarL